MKYFQGSTSFVTSNIDYSKNSELLTAAGESLLSHCLVVTKNNVKIGFLSLVNPNLSQVVNPGYSSVLIFTFQIFISLNLCFFNIFDVIGNLISISLIGYMDSIKDAIAQAKKNNPTITSFILMDSTTNIYELNV